MGSFKISVGMIIKSFFKFYFLLSFYFSWMPSCYLKCTSRGSSLCQEDPLERGMATHSSTLAWRIHGPRSLVGYSPWGHKESDRTERLKETELKNAGASGAGLGVGHKGWRKGGGLGPCRAPRDASRAWELPIPACPGRRGRRGPCASRWLDQGLPGLRRWALQALANPA